MTRVLITMDTASRQRKGVPFATLELKSAYVDSVIQAGGTPLLGPPGCMDLYALADAVVVTGGDFDIPPSAYGKSVNADNRMDRTKEERTNYERVVLERALADNKPILAVCGGMQLLNVVLGGTLLQDILGANPQALDHEQPGSPSDPGHEVAFSGLMQVLNGGGVQGSVNSTHHQAVEQLGRGVVPCGHAPDGVVEAFVVQDHPYAVGVQWHPELLDDPLSRALYSGLVRGRIPQAQEYKENL